jgi:hypothetical protein
VRQSRELNISVKIPYKDLYGCKSWSLTITEEYRLRVLRRIFGPMREEVTGEWRKLHNEEHHILYFSSNIIKMIK